MDRVDSDNEPQNAASDQPAVLVEKKTDSETDGRSTGVKDVCSPYIDNIEEFFLTLDSRSYIHDFDLG
jgi:hypothetical protein